MNLNTFFTMELKDKIKLLQQHGEYICHIREKTAFVDLYSVGPYLVEVRHNMNLFKIESVHLLSTKDERLELYAAKVNISDLFVNN